jgi:hypothetical protein
MQDTNHTEFRADLMHDHHVHIGHFSRNGISFFDEEYTNIKRRANTYQLHIPKQSFQNVSGIVQKEVQNFTRIYKSVEIQDNPSEGQPIDEFNSFIDIWSNLIKIPQLIPKYAGKNENMWRTGIFAHIYRFLIREYDTLFEEDRDLGTSHLVPQINNLMLVGMQKTKDLRALLSKHRTAFQQHPSMPNMETMLLQGEVILPFFACKEACDKAMQFQAENELACALKKLSEAQIKFFAFGSSQQRKRMLLGLTLVGPTATSYIMRRKFINEGLVEDSGKEENMLFCMQPMESYNLNTYDDLIKLVGFLFFVRKHGEENYKEIGNKLKSMIQATQAHSDSNCKLDTRKTRSQPSTPSTKTSSSIVPSPPRIETQKDDKKRVLEDDHNKPNKKQKNNEGEASSNNQEEEESSDHDEPGKSN